MFRKALTTTLQTGNVLAYLSRGSAKQHHRHLSAMSNTDVILRTLLCTIADNEGFKHPETTIRAMDSGGANFTSTLSLITLRSSDNRKLELFGKVAGFGEELREAIKADRLYSCERYVYKELRVKYDELQRRHVLLPDEEKFMFPKFYGCNDKHLEEAVILENLVAKGYTTWDRFKSIDFDYGRAAVGQMAKFHALSYAFADDDPNEFSIVAEKMKYDLTSVNKDVSEMFDKAAKNAVNVVSPDAKDRLAKFLSAFPGSDMYRRFMVTRRRPVLVHGDYKTSNLFFKKKDDKVERLIPVDYQLVLTAPQVTDLFYFIFTSTDGEFRRNHFRPLLEHYYTTFSDFMARLGLDSQKLYSRHDYEQELLENLPFGLLVGTLLLPIMLVDAQNAPEIDGTMQFGSFAVQPNSLYKTRLDELVEDFTEWGVLKF